MVADHTRQSETGRTGQLRRSKVALEARSRTGSLDTLHADAIPRPRAQPDPSAVEPGRDRASARRTLHPASRRRPDRHPHAAQEQHLRFGPRWSLPAQHALGRWAKPWLGSRAARLAGSDDLADAWIACIPSLLDLATGSAMELVEGYRADEPLGSADVQARCAMHGPLPQRFVESPARQHPGNHVPTGRSPVFDVTLLDRRSGTSAGGDPRASQVRQAWRPTRPSQPAREQPQAHAGRFARRGKRELTAVGRGARCSAVPSGRGITARRGDPGPGAGSSPGEPTLPQVHHVSSIELDALIWPRFGRLAPHDEAWKPPAVRAARPLRQQLR